MTMTPVELKSALEAIIYAADEPATVEQLAGAVGEEKHVVRTALDELVGSYGSDERGDRNSRRRRRLPRLHQAAAPRRGAPLHQEPAPAAAPHHAGARNPRRDRL